MKRLLTGLCLAMALLQPALASDASQSVQLVFAGDITLAGKPGALLAKGRDPFAAFAGLFRSADIRIGNLECVIAKGGKPADKNFTFRAHPRSVPVLGRHFDALSLANNHSGDFGREAFAEMLLLLQQQGIGFFGGGKDLASAHAPLIIERKGLRIALLGYNEFMPRSFEADVNAPGVAWSEDERVVADIRRARQIHGADLVIPVMHWGWENETRSNARQQQLARLMIDAGADVVLGTHPHVTQEIEIYRGKPVVYSVGNFVMEHTDNANQRRGWLISLALDKLGVTGLRTTVAALDANGIAHAAPAGEAGPCWTRGQDAPRSCSAAR